MVGVGKGRRKALAVGGMILAILGGISWLFHPSLTAVILWGAAGLILIKLKKRDGGTTPRK
jgi:hypothetical protein